MNKYDSVMRQLGALPPTRIVHLNEEDIVAAEVRLGALLPDDYREFIRNFGGFCVGASCEIPAGQEYDWASIELFTKINPIGGNEDDISSYHDALVGDEEPWPNRCIPIGNDGGSSVIGLSLSGEDRGAVFVMCNFDPVCLVADTFDQFINTLRTRDTSSADIEYSEKFWRAYLGEA